MCRFAEAGLVRAVWYTGRDMFMTWNHDVSGMDGMDGGYIFSISFLGAQ